MQSWWSRAVALTCSVCPLYLKLGRLEGAAFFHGSYYAVSATQVTRSFDRRVLPHSAAVLSIRAGHSRSQPLLFSSAASMIPWRNVQFALNWRLQASQWRTTYRTVCLLWPDIFLNSYWTTQENYSCRRSPKFISAINKVIATVPGPL
jgi:hypothetical protein